MSNRVKGFLGGTSDKNLPANTGLNESFDSAISVALVPDDGVLGGLGDETSVMFSMSTGSYTYTVSASGYQDVTGSVTIESTDLGNTKTITFTMSAQEQQGGDNL